MADWRDMARCREVDPDLFFPLCAGPLGQRQIAEAKAVCAGCPVIAECLAFALTQLPEGIAGGTTPAERVALRRGQTVKRSAAVARQEAAVRLRAQGVPVSVIGCQIGVGERSVYRLLRKAV
jgi:WhiB family redox-sensing transcriptional regulator